MTIDTIIVTADHYDCDCYNDNKYCMAFNNALL